MWSFVFGDSQEQNLKLLEQGLLAENANIPELFDNFKSMAGVINAFFLWKNKAGELDILASFIHALTPLQQTECINLMSEENIAYLLASEKGQQATYLDHDFLCEEATIALIRNASSDLLRRRLGSIDSRNIMMRVTPNVLAAFIRADTLTSFMTSINKLLYYLIPLSPHSNYLEAIVKALIQLKPGTWAEYLVKTVQSDHNNTFKALVETHQLTFLSSLLAVGASPKEIIDIINAIPGGYHSVLLCGSKRDAKVSPPIFSASPELFIQLLKKVATAPVALRREIKDAHFAGHLVNYLLACSLDERFECISLFGSGAIARILTVVNKSKHALAVFSEDSRVLNYLFGLMQKNYNIKAINVYAVFYKYTMNVVLLAQPTSSVEAVLDFINRFPASHLHGLFGFAQAELSCSFSDSVKLLVDITGFLIAFDPDRLARGMLEDNALVVREIKARNRLKLLYAELGDIDCDMVLAKSDSYFGSAMSYASNLIWASPINEKMKLSSVKCVNEVMPIYKVLFHLYDNIKFCLFAESSVKEKKHNITCWSVAESEIKAKLAEFIDIQSTSKSLPWNDVVRTIYHDLYEKLVRAPATAKPSHAQ